ncbi:hypothetical protein [Marinobacter sp. NFXS9]|uniref:hypothetical protein n=1 Tax=Marinobacter sp. NFXS9 TaxID=2818433 RepID=UPI0032DEADD0
MVGVYRFCLASALVVFVGTITLAIIGLTVNPDSGNGGAFSAALSFGVVSIGLAIGTPPAWIAAGISYICQEDMPQGALSHYAVPTVMALPGTLLFLVAAWTSI